MYLLELQNFPETIEARPTNSDRYFRIDIHFSNSVLLPEPHRETFLALLTDFLKLSRIHSTFQIAGWNLERVTNLALCGRPRLHDPIQNILGFPKVWRTYNLRHPPPGSVYSYLKETGSARTFSHGCTHTKVHHQKTSEGISYSASYIVDAPKLNRQSLACRAWCLNTRRIGAVLLQHCLLYIFRSSLRLKVKRKLP